MRFIISRHGNTFLEEEKAVWLGGDADPPLVPRGEQQAVSLGQALKSAGIQPSAVFCSPLQRTSKYAAIVVETLQSDATPIVDQRLIEIDYGVWDGLSNEEVIERCGREEFENWYIRSIWPASAVWRSSELSFRGNVQSFIQEICKTYNGDQTVLAITSHGVLKCIGRSMKRSYSPMDINVWCRVDTGQVCDIHFTAGGSRVAAWNASPDIAFEPGGETQTRGRSGTIIGSMA